MNQTKCQKYENKNSSKRFPVNETLLFVFRILILSSNLRRHSQGMLIQSKILFNLYKNKLFFIYLKVIYTFKNNKTKQSDIQVRKLALYWHKQEM